MRQANRFLAVMDNFNKIQGIHNELLEAGGTLNKGYAKYLDSVEASANRARVAYEEMWIKALDSDTIKDYYEALALVTELIGKMDILRLALILLSTILLHNSKAFDKFRKALGEGLTESLLNTIKNARQAKREITAVGNATTQASAQAKAGAVANKALAEGFKASAVGAQMLGFAIQSLITLGAGAVIGVITTWITKLIGASREASRQAKELVESATFNVQAHRDNIKTLSQLRNEFDELDKKLGENRDSTKLTAQEQERYNSIVEQLRQIAPEVVVAYNEKGEAVLDYGLKIDDLIEKEKELINLESSRVITAESSIIKDSTEAIKKKNKELDKSIQKMQLFRDVAEGRFVNPFDYPNLTTWEIMKATNPYSQRDMGTERAEALKLQAEQKVLLREISEEQAKQFEILDYYLKEEINNLEGVSEAMKNIARSKISEIFDQDGFDKAKSAIGLFHVAYENMVSAVQETDTSKATDSFDVAREALVELGIEAQEAEMMIYEFVYSMDATEDALGRVSASIALTADDFKNLKKTIDELDTSFNKLATGKDLSSDELIKYIDEYDKLAEYVAETGDLTLKNGELIKTMRDEQLEQTIQEMKLRAQSDRVNLEGAKAKLEMAQAELDKREELFGVESRVYQQQLDWVRELEIEIKGLEGQLAKTTVQTRAMENMFGKIFQKSEIETFSGAFGEASKKLEAYKDILEEIDKYGTLSGETNRKIAEGHSELIYLLGQEGEMRKVLTQLIDEQRDKQIESYKSSLVATDDFSKKVFNSNKELFNRIADLYGIDLKNFRNLQSLKSELAQMSLNVLSESGARYVGEIEGETERIKGELSLIKTSMWALENEMLTSDLQTRMSSMTTDNLSDLSRRRKELELQLEMIQATESAISNINVDIDFTSKRSKSKEKTFQRVELVELITDRYLKFNRALEEVERSLTKNDQLLGLATGQDRVVLLGKEIELLNEKQKLQNLIANEYRKEREELRKQLSSTINLDDGTLGADSFKIYAKSIENSINQLIKQINASTDDTVRDALTQKKDQLQKDYDKLEEAFERLVELEFKIPDLGVEWWDIEFEKFNKNLENIDLNMEKYSKRIDYINNKLSVMTSLHSDSSDEIEKELSLLKDISDLYKESLSDIEKRLEANASIINNYETRLKKLGDIRNSEYEDITRRLVMVRAEQDKLFEIQKEGLVSYANQQKAVADKYTESLNRAKEDTLKALDEIRVKMDGFDRTGFENSISRILADLDKIDKIFIRGAEFNLSTRDARKDLATWRGEILSTIEDVELMQERIQDVMSIQALTEEDQIAKREKLISIIEEQIGKENDLKNLERDLRDEIEKTALEHKKIEDALENRIEMKQKELEQLQEQYDQEDKIRRMLEKQLELMRAFDDQRYSYITGLGEEIFTYDQGRVADIQKQMAELTRQNERDEAVDKINKEIEKMQEDLETTREINQNQLEVLKLAQNGVSNIISILNENISSSQSMIEDIYKDMERIFIDGIKSAMSPVISKLDDIWKIISDRMPIGTTSDTRLIDRSKLGDATVQPATQKSPSSEASYYMVKPNDTLSKIASQLKTTVSEILKLNPDIKNPSLIYPNQKIKIPRFDTGGYTGEFDNNGRLAILDQKELVLDRYDTMNVLNAVKVAKNIAKDMGLPSKIEGNTIVTNNNEKPIVMYNSFHGIEKPRDFANAISNLLRDGMPDLT